MPVRSFVNIFAFGNPSIVENASWNPARYSGLAVCDHWVNENLWERNWPWREPLHQPRVFVKLEPRNKILAYHLVHHEILRRQALQYTIRCFTGSLAHRRQKYIGFIGNQINAVSCKRVISFEPFTKSFSRDSQWTSFHSVLTKVLNESNFDEINEA